MALVLPLLLLLVFGIIDFGRALNTQITLTQGAREGARAAALHDPGLVSRVDTATQNIGAVSTSVVTACANPSAPNTQAVVQVSKTFVFVTPFGAIAGMFGGGPGGSINMSGKGVMRCV